VLIIYLGGGNFKFYIIINCQQEDLISMRQVPKRYGVIGDGHLARHFTHYLSLLGLSCTQWHRKLHTNVIDHLADCDVILILISDDSLESFSKTLEWESNPLLVHCSGSKVVDSVWGIHPLMTFGPQLYDLPTYINVPFICEKGEHSFERIFPDLENRCFSIDKTQKALYHSLCVMSGNFPIMLWHKSMMELKKMGIDQSVLSPYLEQGLKNFQQDGLSSLTGPLVRGDLDTIRSNLRSLDGDEFAGVYKSFVNAYDEMAVR
jgi:2-dehydropantoate 2-reductase